MRIWLCPSAFYPRRGGVEELSMKLAQQLIARRHDVLVVTHADAAGVDSVEGVPIRRLRFSAPSRSAAATLSFARDQGGLQASLTALPRPDLIHIQCPSNQTAALAWWSRRHRVPLVITTQGETVMDADAIYARSGYLRTVLRLASRQATALTACSQWTAGRAANTAPAFHRATVIFNGVEASDWVLPPAPTGPLFCAWGRHVPQKGFDLLLKAFALLRERLPQARLELGGDGPEHERLAALAGPGVTLPGALDRAGVAALLGRSRVAVVPSRIEPFGIVALEALAAGRALVYSRHGGLGEATGGLGLPVDPFDTDAFARVLEQSVTAALDPDAGRARADQLSWQVVTAEYGELYERCVAGPVSRRA